MPTQENLAAAFAGESQANRKYLAYAAKAEKDGFPQVAKLFRAVAEAETIHAHAELRAMGGVQDTIANLKDAIEGEAHEFREMYPGFIKEAEAEDNKAAARAFTHANGVEEVHHGLYTDALKAVEGGGDMPGAKIHVCEICGHTVIGEPGEKCPICGAVHTKYKEIA